jgi:hypothetical protein
MQTNHEIDIYLAPIGYVTVCYRKDVELPDYHEIAPMQITREITDIQISGDSVTDMLSDKARAEVQTQFNLELANEDDDCDD